MALHYSELVLKFPNFNKTHNTTFSSTLVEAAVQVVLEEFSDIYTGLTVSFLLTMVTHMHVHTRMHMHTLLLVIIWKYFLRFTLLRQFGYYLCFAGECLLPPGPLQKGRPLCRTTISSSLRWLLVTDLPGCMPSCLVLASGTITLHKQEIICWHCTCMQMAR